MSFRTCHSCGALNDGMDARCADCGAEPENTDAALVEIELGYWCLNCRTESEDAYCGICGADLLPRNTTAATGQLSTARPMAADRSE